MVKTTYKTFRFSSDNLFDVINHLLLVIVLLVVFFPLFFVVNASFSEPNAVQQGRVLLYPVNPTLEAYARTFRDGMVWLGYRNVIIYAVTGTCINVIMTVLGAYPLSRKDFHGRNLFSGIILFTMFFHGGLIPSYLLIKDLGMINTIWVMIIPNAVSVWNVIITRTYFQTTIPIELREASQIDGCRNFAFLLRIVLPLSMPIIAVIALFYAVGHWNEFMRALIYLNDEKKYPLQLILRNILIQNQIDSEALEDVASALERQKLSQLLKYALIIVASLPLLIVYPFLQRFFIKGMMIGSIKG